MAAALIAAFFGVFALFDDATIPGVQASVDNPWPGMNMLVIVPAWCYFALAVGLAMIPILLLICARAQLRAAQELHPVLTWWRSFVWGASVIETTGCLILVMHTTLIFVPSAVALMIAGVAELAIILHIGEQLPHSATNHATT